MINNKLGYRKAKKYAHKCYKNIGRVLCPTLNNEYVVFNNIGFNHLIRKLKIRSRREQKRRFYLLSYAEKILKNAKTFIEYRQEDKKIIVNRQGNLIPQSAKIYYWTFHHDTKTLKIKLVVRQVGQGQKHFYSIMADKRKKTP